MGCGGSKNDTQVAAETPKATNQEAKQSEVAAPATESSDKQVAAPEPGSEEFSEFEQTALTKHNEYRALHGCPPLTLTRQLCTVAQTWSDHLAETQGFEHSTSGYGENLYMSAASGQAPDGDGATQSWYDEIKDYDFSNGGFSMATGHFTQVVWKETTEMGIAAATYQDGDWTKIVVTANYSPPGNMQDAFEENVPALQ